MRHVFLFAGFVPASEPAIVEKAPAVSDVASPVPATFSKAAAIRLTRSCVLLPPICALPTLPAPRRSWSCTPVSRPVRIPIRAIRAPRQSLARPQPMTTAGSPFFPRLTETDDLPIGLTCPIHHQTTNHLSPAHTVKPAHISPSHSVSFSVSTRNAYEIPTGTLLLADLARPARSAVAIEPQWQSPNCGELRACLTNRRPPDLSLSLDHQPPFHAPSLSRSLRFFDPR
jgi:hypothetical protein